MKLNLTDDELDALLIKHAKNKWQKVAMVIGSAMSQYETWDENRVCSRISALVKSGKLESAGDIAKWRFSEVRLYQVAPHTNLIQMSAR